MDASDPRSALGAAYDAELARMEQVLHLLAHWVPIKLGAGAGASPASSGASPPGSIGPDGMPLPGSGDNGSGMDQADELVRSFQVTTNHFRRDVLEWPESALSVMDPSGRYVPSPQPRPPPSLARLRMCEAIATMSLAQSEGRAVHALQTDSLARSHSPATASQAGGVMSTLNFAAGASASTGSGGSGSRIAPISHPLLPVLTRFLLHVLDALCMNALEVAVFSLYLDRLAPLWSVQMERGAGAASPRADGHNGRLLHFVAYMAKLSMADPAAPSTAPGSGTPADPLQAYLTALWPDFSLNFCQWLHYRGAKQMPTPPAQLNQRFYALTSFVGSSTRHGTM